MKRTCCYVLTPAKLDQPATYCGKPVGYTTPVDPETGLRTRKHNSFCEEHNKEEDEGDDYE